MPKVKPAQRRKLWPPVSPEPKSHSLPPPHAMEPKDWEMTRTWTPEPFQKQSVHVHKIWCRSPLPYFTINSQIPKPSNWNQLQQHFRIPACPNSLFKIHPEPWIRETNLSLASLFSLAIRPFLFSKTDVVILASMSDGQWALTSFSGHNHKSMEENSKGEKNDGRMRENNCEDSKITWF